MLFHGFYVGWMRGMLVYDKGWFTWSPKSRVPLMSASPDFWASRNHNNMVHFHESYIFIILCKNTHGTLLRVGSSKKLVPWVLRLVFESLNTSLNPHLQNLLPCTHSCHTWDMGHETWDFVWSGKSQLPCCQWLRLDILTSSDLGLRTWKPSLIPLSLPTPLE